MAKRILAVDFDGVLHSYTSGWQGANVVNDPPVPGAMTFLLMAVQWFEVAISSARSSQEGGIAAMKAAIKRWMVDAGTPSTDVETFVETVLQWPTVKPSAFLTLDDRAIRFDGTFPKPSDLVNFKPWNYGAISG